VHVFDEAHLHIILQELDTITDFVDYLRARRRIIEGGALFVAASEEDLLALYVKDVNEKGEHDFVVKSGISLMPGEHIGVLEGSYKEMRNREEYHRKKRADAVSYLWDYLIEKFARNYLGGTLAPMPDGLGEFDGRNGGAELGLRYMALERRINRRAHSEAILGAFERLNESGGNRLFRAMLDENLEKSTGFCILLMKRAMMPEGTSFDDYRTLRSHTLAVYVEGLLERNRHLKRVVGIATEGEIAGPKSEDLIYMEPPTWTEEAIREARERESLFEIFRSDIKYQSHSSLEYPENDLGRSNAYRVIPYHFYERTIPEESSRGNRRQRRAAAAKRRRR
jgi:hypothetical protein